HLAPLVCQPNAAAAAAPITSGLIASPVQSKPERPPARCSLFQEKCLTYLSSTPLADPVYGKRIVPSYSEFLALLVDNSKPNSADDRAKSDVIAPTVCDYRMLLQSG
ncbi:hypothetical protein TGAM01_v210742, partial [Trichoderma gamsii]